MKKLIAAGFGLCFAGAAFAGQNSCSFAQHGICIESATFDMSGDCEAQGGSIGTTCATENRVGSCDIKAGEDTITARYYPGFPEDPEASCKENNGTFVRG